MLVKFKLLEIRPIIASRRAELAESPGSRLATVSANIRQAAAGASQRSDNAAASRAVAEGNSRRLIFAEGRRGCQECNWFSRCFSSFSFILFSFQANF